MEARVSKFPGRQHHAFPPACLHMDNHTIREDTGLERLLINKLVNESAIARFVKQAASSVSVRIG